jgi:heterodisulfide reductase subunit B
VEYNASVLAVLAALDVELHELDDWNCCGASSAHSLNRRLSLALPARNLAIAQQAGKDLIMPCAACFNRHKTVQHEMRAHEERRAFIKGALGFEFDGSVSVRPVLDVIGNLVGVDRLRARVTRPLDGLKVVGYYGCLLVRPPEVTEFEDPENPTLMNQVLDALSADVRPWSYATECCGGGLSLTKSNIAARLVDRLVERVKEAGAEAMVTSCPLCQVNLEMRQSDEVPRMPIFYFTELIGLAFGIEEASTWWKKHLIDPTGLLQPLGLQ